MKKDDVPQDKSQTYGGYTRVIYATNADDNYEKVASSGWETEEFVTLMAVDDLREHTLEAYERCQKGVSSPLEYHMYNCRLDLLALSQASGFFQWQIRRHLKPSVFKRLSDKKLARYQDIFDIERDLLTCVPTEP